MSNIRQFFKGFKKGTNNFGKCIVTIINSVLLLIAYLFGIGLTSIFAKLIGKHFLRTKISKTAKSYWSDLNPKKKPVEEYYRQF